jgi:hypothetical protein
MPGFYLPPAAAVTRLGAVRAVRAARDRVPA